MSWLGCLYTKCTQLNLIFLPFGIILTKLQLDWEWCTVIYSVITGVYPDFSLLFFTHACLLFHFKLFTGCCRLANQLH